MTYNPFGVFAWYQAKFFLAASALTEYGAGYCRLYTRNDTNDYFYYLDSAGNERRLVYYGGAGSDDHKVLVSATDTTPQYIYDKITVAGGLTIAHSLGGDEEITLSGGKAMVSIDDTTPNYLLSKLAAGTGITLTETNPGGDEDVTIASTIPDLHEKSFVTISAEAALDNERVLTAGNGISVTDGGAGTTVTIAAEWKDDGTGTLVPTTANDNIAVESSQGIAIYGHDSAASGRGVYGYSDTGVGVYGRTGSPADRTAEKYCTYAYNRAHLGYVADIIEAAVPQDAPTSCVRIFASDDPRGFDMLYQVRDTGQTSPCANGIDYGDGSDGDITLSGATTLTRNMYYKNLTVNAGAFVVNTAGYQIFVREKLTNNGTISCDGNAGTNGGNGVAATQGSGGSGATSRADAYLCGSGAAAGAGGAGGAGGGMPVPPPGTGTAGTAGGARTVAFMNTGGAAGGNASAGSVLGGAGGAATQITAAQGMPRNAVQTTRWEVKGQTMFYTNAASGGGAGGNGGASGAPGAMGGGGGGGGGAGGNAGGLFICARWLENNGTIQALGGDGGNGGNGGDGTIGRANGGDGGGGGAGGQGGIIVIITEYYSGTSPFPTAATNCAGGAGGALGTCGAGNAGGSHGTNGSAGATIS